MYVILGNSGSGKTTLARRLGEHLGVAPCDLDEVYFEPEQPGVAREWPEAVAELGRRLEGQATWIVEGCYESLAEHLLIQNARLIWLDPGEATCLAHCRARPWEPHKYASKQAQDDNLAMLLAWVSDHYRRDGPMSYAAHRALFDSYSGPKQHVRDTSVEPASLA